MLLQCKYAFSYNVIKIKNHHNKNPNIFAFDMFDLECSLRPYIPC